MHLEHNSSRSNLNYRTYNYISLSPKNWLSQYKFPTKTCVYCKQLERCLLSTRYAFKQLEYYI